MPTPAGPSISAVRPSPGQRVAEQGAERGQLAIALHEAAHRRRGRRRVRDRGGGHGLLAQQPLVQRHERRARRRPELLAQQHPDVLEHPQRLGHVAARVQHLHQRRARGLAERRRLDGRPRRALGLVLLRAAHRRPRGSAHLERLQPQVAELGAAHVDPRRLQPRQQPALGDRQRVSGPGERRRRVAGLERRPCRRDARARRLPVDPGVSRQDQAQLAAADQPAVAERPPQPRQRRGQRVAALGRAAVGPHRLHELVPPHRTMAVEHEVGEQEATLPPAQRAFDTRSLYLYRELSTELDAGPHWRATYRDTGVRSIGAGR